MEVFFTHGLVIADNRIVRPRAALAIQLHHSSDVAIRGNSIEHPVFSGGQLIPIQVLARFGDVEDILVTHNALELDARTHAGGDIHAFYLGNLAGFELTSAVVANNVAINSGASVASGECIRFLVDTTTANPGFVANREAGFFHDPADGAPCLQNETLISGTAQGGTLEVVIGGVSIVVSTSAGESAAQVVARLAADASDSPALQSLGIRTAALGNGLVTSGSVDSLVIADAGLFEGSSVVPALGPGVWGWLCAGLLVAFVAERLARRSR